MNSQNISLTPANSVTMGLFLDLLIKDIIQNPAKLVPYTKEMSDYMDDLLADVKIDENEQ